MPDKHDDNFDPSAFKSELEDRGHNLGDLWGCMFEGRLIYVDYSDADDPTRVIQRDTVFRVKQACNIARFAGAQLTNELKEGVTHILVGNDQDHSRTLRRTVSRYASGEKSSMVTGYLISIDRFKRLPRLVTVNWVEQSWKEKTLLDEERKSSSPLAGGP